MRCTKKIGNNSIIAGLFDTDSLDDDVGAFIKINNLLVEVKLTNDDRGYIVDVFNHDTEEIIKTMVIWKEDLTNDNEPDYSNFKNN